MTTIAPNSTALTGGVKTSDPRIISPEIKVIYPSENTQKDLAVSEVQTTAPTPQVLPTAPTQTTTVPTKESTEVVSSSTVPNSTIPQAVEPPKKPTWIDTMKEHAGLFVAVALISLGIGILIGKKV